MTLDIDIINRCHIDISIAVPVASPPGGAGAPREEAPRPPPLPTPRNGTPPSKHGPNNLVAFQMHIFFLSNQIIYYFPEDNLWLKRSYKTVIYKIIRRIYTNFKWTKQSKIFCFYINNDWRNSFALFEIRCSKMRIFILIKMWLPDSRHDSSCTFFFLFKVGFVNSAMHPSRFWFIELFNNWNLFFLSF